MVPAYDAARANAPHRQPLLEVAARILDAGHFILGDRLARFEQSFATFCGTTHCVGVGNGLDALRLVLRAVGVGPGDEVIVPSFTFVATWLAVSQLGATPVPVDVQTDGLIDPALITGALTGRTRAIVPVHLFGRLADMDAIAAIGRRSGLTVVEDAAQAHGAERGGRRAGSFGTAAAFSFYPTKNLGALGDGGAVCTDDPDLAESVRRLRNYGSTSKYRHDWQGDNSRLDELQAAVLAEKLPDLNAANGRRRRVAAWYGTALARIPGLLLPDAAGTDMVWHQYVIRAPDRDGLQSRLACRGVGTAVHYPVAPFDQPCYAGLYDRTRFPVACDLANTVLSLPMGDYLADNEVEQVLEAMLEDELAYA